jgi:hypothetical protein
MTDPKKNLRLFHASVRNWIMQQLSSAKTRVDALVKPMQVCEENEPYGRYLVIVWPHWCPDVN